MSKKCLCQHEFDDHARGPIKEMKSTSRFTLEPVENCLNCKKCNCTNYIPKRSWTDKFWNGSE